MPITNEPSIDPISQRPYTRVFAIGIGYRWIIQILCGFLVMILLVLMLTAMLNPFLSRPPIDWGTFLAIAALASAMLLGTLFYLARLSRKSVMTNVEGLWLSGRDDPESFVRWDKIVDMRERTGVPGWVLLDARGQSLLSIDCAVDGFEELHALLREHTCISRSVRTDFRLVWMGRAYAAACLGMVAVGVFGAWIVWQEGVVGNWWYALAAVALPLYPLFEVLQLRIEPDALVLRRILWKRRIPRNDITAIRMSENTFGPVVAIQCKAVDENILLEHLNVAAHELYEVLIRWQSNTPS